MRPFHGVSRGLTARLRALRAFSFPLSVLPACIAMTVAMPIREWRPVAAVCCLAAVALLHAAGNLLNDLFDFRYGVDRRIRDEAGRPGRQLVRGELSPRSVATLAAGALCAAAPFVLWLAVRVDVRALAFGAAGAFGLYAYTGPPFRFKHRALGEPLVFLVFGPILMSGAAWVQAPGWHGRVLFMALPVSGLTAAVLLGNNLRDMDEDRAAGICTLPLVVGARVASNAYAALVLASLGGIALYGVVYATPLLLVAPAFALFHWPVMVRVRRGERIANIDVLTARLETLVMVFVLVVLLA